MGGERQVRTFDAICRVVVEILESEGYDAVQPKVVAKRARVSLTTIYKIAPTRDDLIATVLTQWMQANCYAGLAKPPVDASLFDGLMWVYRKLFEPWERNPRMLVVYHRAMTGPAGERLDVQGATLVEPVARAFLAKLHPSYAEDVGFIMTNMVCGLIQRAAVGDMPVKAILPMLERTLLRLTGNNEPLASAGADQVRETRRRPKGRAPRSPRREAR